MAEFRTDLQRIWDNCRLYNKNAPEYVELADRMEELANNIVDEHLSAAKERETEGSEEIENELGSFTKQERDDFFAKLKRMNDEEMHKVGN